MIELFVKGGPVMWPLLVTSLVAMAVFFERIVFMFKDRKWADTSPVELLFAHVEKGEIGRAIELGKSSSSPTARVLSYGLLHRGSSLSNALLRAANLELQSYNRGLSTLDTIITLSPLLGLLGTVTGMISAFGLLGAQELDAPMAITGGIAEALIATAFGLGIAICCLIPFNYLNTRLEEVRHQIEDRTNQLELILLSADPARPSRLKMEAA
jgi:biopolymer transport protein ExbB